MKKLLGSCLLAASLILATPVFALDTVVVGQPYYGAYGPYGGWGGYGGYYPGTFYGGYAPYVYPPSNPAMQARAIGSNPYFLGSQVYLNRGNTTRQEVRNAFQKTGAIFLTPNPVNYNTGYYPVYDGAYYPY